MPNPFFESPRSRRLRRDLEEMKILESQSSILTFQAEGIAPSEYLIQFQGMGLGPGDNLVDLHRIQVSLGLEYPRTLPSVKWLTPISHPNISGGTPCFGTFVMNPNVRLVDLVEIMWDMTRLSTYNPYGGYGEKDRWQVLRKQMDFPVDKRILRDKVPPPIPEEHAGGEEDLLILSGARLGGTPPSQVWVKAAMEQFFESRGVYDQAKTWMADEWYAETKEPVPNLIGVIEFSEELMDAMRNDPKNTMWFIEDAGAFIGRLGLVPKASLTPGRYYLISRG